MSGRHYFLGIDVSTTAAKSLLIDNAGQVIAVAASEYSFETPRPLWSEQDPALWWDGAIKGIRAVLAKAAIRGEDIVAVGLTGQMHGLVLLDERGEVLRPAILWNDQRTGAECDEIRARLTREHLIQVTGNDALTGFTAPKILWVQRHEPDIYARSCHVLLPKDTVRFRLTGQYAMDKADGSGTLLFDLEARTWSPEVLKALDIPVEWMPPTFEGPQITGYVTADAAAATGLAEGTPVVAGGGDQAAQAVGVGAVEPGIIAVTLGTSGVVFATTPGPLVEPEGRLHAFCHAVPERWHFMGVMLSAAGSLQWHRDTLAPHMSFDALVAEAEATPLGSEGLLFLPYLTGERTPYPDPLARGAWVGLTARHTRGHLTRAVLEGVAFGFKDSFTLIQNAGLGAIRRVHISGGGAKSRLWQQIMANVLAAELVTVNTTEGAAYGAGLLAGVGVNRWPSVDAACADTIKITGRIQPSDRQVALYAEYYALYRELYPALAGTFARLAELH